MKIFIHVFFIMLILIVTFFGVGPVLLADGTLQERILTIVIVLSIYIIISFLYSRAIQWVHNKK